MKEYLYTTMVVDGITRYFETYLNPDGVWDAEGRVDYRVQIREVTEEEWFLLSVLNG